ncbi:MAG: hypothetical protein A2X36_14460 [Elusimicrobia bacterium GWA2_69_24]|nr:MAG: hypothetical protein A2X36_14460 [Elusimicrobia bacterium GWA2_69_24]HBL18405.1 hypothetical protein [Elusimicrobiota bacterium]
MAVVLIIAKEEQARAALRLAVEELGHTAALAMDLKNAVELIPAQRPRLFLIAQDPGDSIADSALVELEREAPLLPIVVTLTRRDAPRAMELLKAGVLEVVAPPWTPENLAACLSKALRFKGTALESFRLPVEASRGLWIYVAAAVLLFALAAGYGLLRRRERLAALAAEAVRPRAWDLPSAYPAGFAFDGRDFWVADWYAQSLSRHRRSDLRVEWTRHLPKEVPGAIAFAGDALWVAAAPRSIVKHMLDDRLTVLTQVRDAAPQTVGMAYDGLYLWTCDAAEGKLHKRILDSELTVAASYPYPGKNPAALAYDGRALWSLDAGNRELLRHDLAMPERVTARLPLPEYQSGDWKPTGLAFDGESFWSVGERRGKGEGSGRVFLHRLPPELLKTLRNP